MSENKGPDALFQEARPRINEWQRVLRVISGRKVNIFGLVILAIFLVVALAAPWLAPYNPNQQDLKAILQQPRSDHLLGTDHVGRDTLSRVIYGARISLLVGIVAVCIAAIAGTALGLCAGAFDGWTQ